MDEQVKLELENDLEARRFRQVGLKLSEQNPADAAEFLETLSEEQLRLVFRMLKKSVSAEVFSFLSPDVQETLALTATDKDLAFIIEELYTDDAVDFLEELPATLVKKVLSNATPENRLLLNRFLNYPEDSAGSVMTSEYLDFKENMTVAKAIAHIRKTGLDKETVHVGYVIDSTRHLLGMLDIVDLLYADPDALIRDVMHTPVISVTTTDDKEHVAKEIAKYDFLAIPVVDGENRLVGIVTVDDAIDVVTEEATEDMEKMAALHPSDTPYLKTGVFSLYKNRILWLLFLMLSGMITGTILGGYEHAIASIPLLVTFIPMLTDTGGNAGSQSATLIIRGMSLGEVSAKDWLKVLWKELRVSLLVGITLGALNYLRVLLFYPGQEHLQQIALTLAISMIATVILAKTVGSLLPILAKRFHADPAVMAAPLVTTIVDSLTLLVYFGIATALFAL